MRMKLSHGQHQQIPNIGTLAVLRGSQSVLIDQKLMNEQEQGLVTGTNLGLCLWKPVSWIQESKRRHNDSTCVPQLSFK
jgi:hypothetical protein